MTGSIRATTLLSVKRLSLLGCSLIFTLTLAGLALSLQGDLLLRQLPLLGIGLVVLGLAPLLAYNMHKTRLDYRQALSNLKQIDSLTGLSNRQVFLSAVHERLKSAKFQTQRFALLLVDIDRFKELDTILGTENGDLLLQDFASRLRLFQEEGCYVARLSGNEFAILIDVGDSTGDLAHRIEGLHAYLKRPFRFHGRPIDITVSGGYSLFPRHGYKSGPLLQKAKLALLRAKQEGRDQICLFEQHHDVRSHIDHELSQEMGKSIGRGDFELHYQPQFCMKTGEQVGFEALMRWNHATRGWISPGTFIEIAERNGLILTLSEFALREACRTAAQWEKPYKVAVNLSPIQFKKTDLVQLVSEVLKETGLDPKRLELEVTESLFIKTNQKIIDSLKFLRTMGVSIALDDFGTGYSSLSYLSAFPIDKIKIDRSFVRDLAGDSGDMAIVSAMIGIGKSLDMRITAEGIEDAETLELLRIAGCHEAQGYYLGRPRDLAADPVEHTHSDNVIDFRALSA